MAFGDAQFFGSMGGQTLTQPVVGMAPTPSGRGYRLLASDGGVFAFGDAGFFGSMGGRHLNQPIVGMATNPFGSGSWLVAADGGVFAFGSSRFFGSMGGSHLNQPMVGMAAAPFALGYWLVAADGGVFAFGDAGILRVDRGTDPHPTGGGHGGEPIGAWLLAGGVRRRGVRLRRRQLFGSMGGQPSSNPITAIAGTPTAARRRPLPTTPPATDWAAPGTVIYNLDTRPVLRTSRVRKWSPSPSTTGPPRSTRPRCCSILVADHVPASFQIIGQNGAAYPDLLRQEAADGMSLVNHTWTHVDLTTLAPSGWTGQVDQTNSLLQSITGHMVRCLRPPYGFTDSAVVAQLGQRGLAELYWDVDPSDYLRPGASVIVERVLSALSIPAPS